MNYFNYINSDLINIIGLYLNYNVILLISNIFKIEFNYEYLLFTKYNAFYKIINFLKKEDVEYKNYSYERGFSVMISNKKINNKNMINIDIFLKFFDDNYIKYSEIIDYKAIVNNITLYNEWKYYFPLDKKTILFEACRKYKKRICEDGKYSIFTQ